MRSSLVRRAAFGALVLGAALGAAGTAYAGYKLHFGWSPRPHFPAPLVDAAAKPNTWLFKTRAAPELEVRRGNWELRVNWDRTDLAEYPFPRIFRQMLRLGCEIVDPQKAKELLDRLYATRSLVPARDMGPERGVTILHRLSVFDSGCVIAMEARGTTKMHLLKVVVAPPPPPRPKPKTN